jgi:hypothetical protein
MSKKKPKQPMSFRVKAELYDKFKSYCERYDLNQTQVFEKFIERLQVDTEPNDIEPISIDQIHERLKALEAKIERVGLIDGNTEQAYNAEPIEIDNLEVDSSDWIETRIVAYALGYPNSKNLSGYMKKEKIKGIRKGKGKAWNIQDVIRFAKKRSKPLNKEALMNPETIPDDYE